jgi:hypothetical protein
LKIELLKIGSLGNWIIKELIIKESIIESPASYGLAVLEVTLFELIVKVLPILELDACIKLLKSTVKTITACKNHSLIWARNLSTID